ncbi:RNA polymerase Rpc34 subunit-domain-containing protein [Panaeolus papilionaceus]|nr:RNA polymerase Rpc34 subunit-domain-containing protein [Panaeolus papilionaceus]
MSKRPPNELESRLHQAALASKELTAKQAESIVPDPTARRNALNFLLSAGLFKLLTNSAGQVSFRAVSKEEVLATKGLSGEENLVLSHIKHSGNEGIWTKHLKAKTNLHQTVIDRCLKTLTQKRLIKRVQSVQHITRKIYMLEGLEPSISLTGGPWYTDNELDTEFIQNLMEACYRLISDITFPKVRGGSENLLYPISNAPKYPTADQIRTSLRKARLTETELTVEHVEMLLNVLVLDGKIEKLPAFGSALWNTDAIPDGDEGSDDESEKRSKKRKKRIDSSDDEIASKSSKKKRKKRSHSTDDSDSSDDESSRKKSKRKRSKRKDDSEESDSDRDGKKGKKKKKRKQESSDSDSPSEEQSSRRKKSKKKKRWASSDTEESSSSDSESEPQRERKRKKSVKHRSESPADALDLYDTSGGGKYMAPLGLTEAPCGLCPSFEFCKDDGPVNARECTYYGDWLEGGTLANEEDVLGS